MFELLIVLVVIGVVAVLVMRTVAAGRSHPSADEQTTVVRPDTNPAGSDRPATKPDGEPIPGSEEDRHRHGKP